MAKGLSGLQRDVLALYRRALRMTRTKPPATRHRFLLFVRYTFHQNALKVTPRNVSAIEHMMRVGTRQLETYEHPSVKDCWLSQDMLDWEAVWKSATAKTNASQST